jgi:hypothetical protein
MDRDQLKVAQGAACAAVTACDFYFTDGAERLEKAVEFLQLARRELQHVVLECLDTIEDAIAAEQMPPYTIWGEPFSTAHQASLWMICNLLNRHKRLSREIGPAQAHSKLTNLLVSVNQTAFKTRIVDECSAAIRLLTNGPRPINGRSEVRGRAGNREPTPVLTKEAASVLMYLASRQRVLATIDDIEAGADLSRATANKSVTELVRVGYADRPHGPNKGVAATDEGLAVAAKLSTNLA